MIDDTINKISPNKIAVDHLMEEKNRTLIWTICLSAAYQIQANLLYKSFRCIIHNFLKEKYGNFVLYTLSEQKQNKTSLSFRFSR